MARRRAGLSGWRIVAALVVIVVASAGIALYTFLQRDVPQTYASVVEHFKYGSIGTDTQASSTDPGGSGIPYWIWYVLPRVFPAYLPHRPGQGYERLGFVYESPAAPRPIGTSYREQPFGLVGLNCAVCHTGTIRYSPQGPEHIMLGMPAQQLDLQGYFRFLFKCAQDKRFNAATLLAAIKKADPSLSPLEEAAYRFVVIPRTRDALVKIAGEFAWWNQRPSQGPGRVDTFNPYKIRHFHLPDDHSVGTADLPSLWDQRVRKGMWLHWDGNNNSLQERNLSAALGAGATEASVDVAALQRVAAWIQNLKPPAYPHGKINWSRVPAGQRIYQAQCAECHALNGHYVGQVDPIGDIGTDRSRLDSFTATLAQKMNTFGAGKPWHFTHFRTTNGYANMPLDGLWLRGPYLHNGSVPTLRDLLKPPQDRPVVFYRGDDVYDFGDVGFVSSGPAAMRNGVRYDTRARGNGNGGHLYGTDLSPGEKNDLLEYLKTL